MKEKLKSYGIIALGSVIFGLAFDWFFDPNQVAMGGITGLAQVINALLPAIPVGVLTIVLNVPLFIAGWRYIGFHLLASSLFSMAVSSVAIDLIAVVYPFGPMDPMLGTLCGGALMGLSLGSVLLIFGAGFHIEGIILVIYIDRPLPRSNQLVELFLQKPNGKRWPGRKTVDQAGPAERQRLGGQVGNNTKNLFPLRHRRGIHGLQEEVICYGGDFPCQRLHLLLLRLADLLIVQHLPIPWW